MRANGISTGPSPQLSLASSSGRLSTSSRSGRNWSMTAPKCQKEYAAEVQ